MRNEKTNKTKRVKRSIFLSPFPGPTSILQTPLPPQVTQRGWREELELKNN